MFKKTDAIILCVILLIALSVRLYRIDSPLADWHSWRQADTAAVARNYSRDGIDLLHPKFDDLSDIQSGIHNPEGYRFVEFPLFNAITSIVHNNIPHLSIEMSGRAVSIVFSLILISILYYLLSREEGRIAAIAGASVFSLFPFFVYYSRVVLPDMTALSLMFTSIFFLYIWVSGDKKKTNRFTIPAFILSLLFASISLLVKPTTVFYFVPICYLFFHRYRYSAVKRPAVYAFFLLSIIPFVLWRSWISQFPEGIPAFIWLFTTVNTFEGPKVVFFRPAFFRWIFYERILLLILGGYSAMFAVLGLSKKPQRNYFLHSFTISSALYLFTFQGGNVQHDYYQIMILPSLAVLSGIGISFVLSKSDIFINRALRIIAVIAIIIFSIGMSLETVKGYYNYSDGQVQIGNVIKTITPSNAHIVTDSDGDTTLLYLSDRKGYPAVTESLDKLKERGISYFVTSKSDVAEHNKDEYELIFQGSDVFIFKL